ncbi:MAG TPA: universal stress protein, partial [Puia sp.]
KFMPIKEIALLYDGSASSVHSIKMFEYTLPGMKKMKTKLYYAKGENGFPYLPDNDLLKEWMKNHYPKAQYKILEGNEREIILTLAAENSGVLIVTGSYNRSNISMWFHKSFADQLMNQLKAPLFLAHL